MALCSSYCEGILAGKTARDQSLRRALARQKQHANHVRSCYDKSNFKREHSAVRDLND